MQRNSYPMLPRETRAITSKSAFASTDPSFESYDALRDVVTMRSRHGDDGKAGHSSQSRVPSRLSSAADPSTPPPRTMYDSSIKIREVAPSRGRESGSDASVGRSVGFISAASSHSSQDANPTSNTRTESPPLEDISPTARAQPPVFKREQTEPGNISIRGVGVGNSGTAVRGELCSFQVICRTLGGDNWHWAVRAIHAL